MRRMGLLSKTKNRMPSSTLGAFLLIGVLLCGVAIPCYGATATWNGGGADDNWTNAANWGGVAPSPGDDLVFAGSTRLTPNNDFPADTSFSSITFSAGAGGFALGGNRIALTGAIINGGNNQQSINFDIIIAAVQNFDAASGDLVLRGVISGAGGITKAGVHSLTLTGVNTFTGSMSIDAGRVVVNGSTAAASAVTVNSGGSLEGNGTVAGTIQVANGGKISPGDGGPLIASFVAASLRSVSEDDWRLTQAIAGTRVDSTINEPSQAFGSAAERAAYGISGSDGDWENFSVQWDGYLRVFTPGTSLSTSSDDGSRVWLDLNDNGVVDSGEWGSNGFGNGQGDTLRVVHANLPAGTYRIRVQYEEGNGGNSMRMLWDDAANSGGGVYGLHVVPASALNASIGTLTTGAVTFNSTSTFRVELDGTIPSYDLLTTADSIVCAGNLVVGNISNSSVGKVYSVINAGTVSGTFAGMPDSSVFVYQGRTLQISYTATQVTLTDIVHPTTRTWVGGGADNNWTTGANWDMNIAPVAGDDLHFDGTTRLSPNNNFPANTTFASITFNSGAGAFVLSGNRITLTGGVLNNDDSIQMINLPVLMNATQTFDAATGDMAIGGVLSGGGGFSKSGTGALTLTGAHTYTGTTTLSAGTLQIGNGTTDGSLASSSIVNNGALIWNNVNIYLSAQAISGNGSLTKNGAGKLLLSGTNTYTGATTVNAGTLTVNGSTAAGSAVSVNSGATLAGSGTVAGSITVANGATVNPDNDLPLTVSFVSNSLRNVLEDDWRATQTISGTRTASYIHHPSSDFGTPADRAAFGISGNDSDWNNFSVQWDGYLRVVTSGTTLYTASDDGSRVWLDLNGNGVVDPGEWGSNGWGTGQPTSERAVHSNLAAGTYRMRVQYEEGTGGNSMSLTWSDAANSAGAYYSGHIVPASNLVSSIATLTTGAVTFNGTSNLRIDLDGLTPSFDQINTAQAVVCAGNLNFGSVGNSSVGHVYTIINAGSVSGTFNGLANGNMVTAQGRTLQIAYTATQVTLTDVARPTRVWDGGGSDNNWTTAANWDYDLAPVAGDDLQFAGTTRLAPNNDFSATSFKSIGFNVGAGDFVVGGNALTLSGGAAAIASNATSGTMTLNTNITFSTAAATVASTAGGTLALGGTINNGGMTLTVAAGGTTSLSGAVSGTGGFAKTGSAAATLSGANTYTGGTTVSAGVLTAGVASIANTSGAFGNNSAVTMADTAGAALNLAGFNTHIGSITGGGSVGGNVTLGAATLTVGGDGTSPLVYAGVISGAGSLIKINNGTLTLGNANVYGGATTIAGGTILMGIAGAANGVTIDNHSFETPNVGGFQYGPSGASWTFNQAGIDRDTTTWYSTLSGHDGVQAAFLQINGSISQTVTVNNAGVHAILFQVQGRGGAFGPSGIIVQVDGSTVASWPASAVSQLQWQDFMAVANLGVGTHTLTFISNNTLGGDKSVCVDNIQMFIPTSSGSLPSTTALNLTASGATLDLNNTTQTIGSLAGVAGTNVLRGSLTAGGDGTSTNFAGVMADTGSLTKAGAGTLTLTGANTYSGGSVISAGTLQIGNAATNGTLGSGTYSISAAARLYLNYATAVGPVWGNISGTGTLELNTAQPVNGTANWASPAVALPAGFTGTLQVDRGRCEGTPAQLGGTTHVVIQDGAQFLGFDGVGNGSSYSYPQNFTINGMGWGESNFNFGALRVAGMNATFTGAIALAGDTAFFTQTFANRTAMTLTGVVSGAGNLTINDQDLGITLTGANTYTGATTLASGTLVINSIKSVSSGASALGAPANATNGTVKLGSSNNPCTLIYTGSGDTSDRVLDLSGSTGAIVLDQSGSGLLKFTSAMTATGNGAKTLLLQGSASGSGEIAGSVVNSGGATSVTKVGTNTWTLSGSNSYTGATTADAGTLLINGSVTSHCTATSPGRIGGSGTIQGNLAGTGQVAPGAAIGSAGVLTVNGDFTPTGTLVFEVNAPASVAGTHYDQIVVNGAVNVSGAVLTFSGGAGIVAQNQVVTLIQNDLADASVASANPAQTSFVSINGNRYSVWYNGGDGNDVVLISYHARRASQFMDFFP